ncbi:hypothetical protein JYU29_09590 [Tianweitania sp. BSSL-BM11]|uniref:CopG family transcriptional regulator n=1 Tax=Tianweitania aestuarii TaxID=2814886 RepID=A0ABS5RV52_9HYPH|nr:DUF6290 family protein [Tianweitania aestuarii]MBS9720936.1 hypothetical protein [Tianweitania aestuarii]
MASSITIDLDDATEALLNKVLSSSSVSASQLVREALLDRLEEIEDAPIVTGLAEESVVPISNAEVMRRLRLDH